MAFTIKAGSNAIPSSILNDISSGAKVTNSNIANIPTSTIYYTAKAIGVDANDKLYFIFDGALDTVFDTINTDNSLFVIIGNITVQHLSAINVFTGLVDSILNKVHRILSVESSGDGTDRKITFDFNMNSEDPREHSVSISNAIKYLKVDEPYKVVHLNNLIHVLSTL